MSCLGGINVCRKYGFRTVALLCYSAVSSFAFTILSGSSSQRIAKSRRYGTTAFFAKRYKAAGIPSTSPEESFRHFSSTSEKYDLHLVMLDHYDSYTYNLYDMFATLCQNPPLVIAADAFPSWTDLEEYLKLHQGSSQAVDGLILSPGPGNPSRASDMGVTIDAIQQNSQLPIFGVCLGHQALAHVYGANVTLAPKGPRHGEISAVHHKQQHDTDIYNLWRDVPEQLDVVRYHSLVVDAPLQENNGSGSLLNGGIENAAPILPSGLKATAWSFDDKVPIIMGLQHTELPHFGVQFHPESIGTQYGYKIIENFCRICQHQKSVSKPRKWIRQPNLISPTTDELPVAEGSRNLQTSPYQVLVHRVDIPKATPAVTPLVVYERHFGNSSHSFWLDSGESVGEFDKRNDSSSCSFSIMGGSDGPLHHRLEYYNEEHVCQVKGLRLITKDPSTGHDNEEILKHDILTHLKRSLSSSSRTNDVTFVSFSRAKSKRKYKLTPVPDVPAVDGIVNGVAEEGNFSQNKSLPFEYRGGYVGFLGYDVRKEALRLLQEMELGSPQKTPCTSGSGHTSPIPTSYFLFADRSLVYDHRDKEWYLVGVAKTGSTESLDNVVGWMQGLESKIISLSCSAAPTFQTDAQSSAESLRADSAGSESPVKFVPNRSRRQYKQDIASCHEKIRLGESYELCLTNQIEADVAASSSPLELIISSPKFAICCSSPERFVSVKRHVPQPSRQADNQEAFFQLESKPIKGTCARKIIPSNRPPTQAELREDQRRAHELQTSVKNRAENLMIVDLLRNDMSRVCQTGTVHVPKLMKIESFATVHQMVSTIRGTLLKNSTAVDALIACFPGGSMTGAPKLRSVEILEELELGVSRGVYSGSLGYLSLNGSMDMNIVIRTACLEPSAKRNSWKVSIGAGGAITALSESEDEYEEMLLKARAVVEAVQAWADGA